MQALLLADHRCPGLAPLTERTASVLLPVAGKPIIEHQLEALANSDVRHVTIAVHPHASQIEARVGSGARWGLEVEFVITHGDESTDEVLCRLDKRGPRCLIVSSLRLRDQCISDFLEEYEVHRDHSVVTAWSDGTSLGLEVRNFEASKPLAKLIDLPHVRSKNVATLDDYLELNLAAVRGEIDLFLDTRELGDSVHLGRRTAVSANLEGCEGVFVGDRTQVHSLATLGPGTVLTRDVLVDRGAELESVVVMPGSYIGADVRLRQAIVWGELVIRLPRRQTRFAEDSTQLATLNARRSCERALSLLGRVAALLVLIISLPLWPFIAVSSWITSPRAPFQGRNIASNRLVRRGQTWLPATATVWSAAVPIPCLGSLPNLLAVVTGDLRWVGVAPSDPTVRAVDPDRQRHAGLIGPAQLRLSANAPETALRLADSYFIVDERPLRTVRWLAHGLRSLFSQRAWRVVEENTQSPTGPTPIIESQEVAA